MSLDTRNWQLNDGKAVIFMSATTPKDKYYGKYFDFISNFQIDYAKAVHGKDNAVILADRSCADYFRKQLPDECVCEYNVEDVWMRDFSPIRLNKQVFCKYQPNYLDKYDAKYFQDRLWKLIDQNKNTLGQVICPTTCNLILDGGNVVDNFVDKAIITERVYRDNKHMSKEKVKQMLREHLGYSQICIIPDCEDRTGHSDGMVAFLAKDKIAITNSLEPEEKTCVIQNIRRDFGNSVDIVGLSSVWGEQNWRKFESACGLHINMVATNRCLYVPVFGGDPKNRTLGQSQDLDNMVLGEIRQHTDKEVVPIEVPNKVCRMGGSVRCMSWSLSKY